MRLIFVNGSQMQLTLREWLRIGRHPATVALCMVAIIGMLTVKPFETVAGFSLPQTMVHTGYVVGCILLGYYGIPTQMARRGLPAVTLAGIVAGAALASSTAPFIAHGFGAPPATLGQSLSIFGYLVVLVATIELVHITFLLPFLLRADAWLESDPTLWADAQPDTETPEQTMALLGRLVPLADLRLVSADEHYVHIHTRTDRLMLRGRISDIEAQLPDAWGRRVHRSHWVATSAVRSLKRSRGAWVLELTDGTEVPVARARRDVVRDWVEGLGRG